MANLDCIQCNSTNLCNTCFGCSYSDNCYICSNMEYSRYNEYCKNLVMTEHNIFCYAEALNDKNSFQQPRYRVFNKQVTKPRYTELRLAINKILPKGIIVRNLDQFWLSVQVEQWEQLLVIPEAKGFKRGFEFISNKKIKVA